MKINRIKYLNKDRLPPGTIRKFDNNSNDIDISVINYNKDRAIKQIIKIEEIQDIKIPEGFNTWIHCPSTINSTMLEEIGKRFEIHPLI